MGFEVATKVEKQKAATSKFKQKLEYSFRTWVHKTKAGAGSHKIRRLRMMNPDLLAIFDCDRRFVRTVGVREKSRRCRKLWKCRTSFDRFGLSVVEVSGVRKGPFSDGDEMSQSKDTWNHFNSHLLIFIL